MKDKIKSKKENVLLSGSALKCLPFLSRRVIIDFIVFNRAHCTFGLQDCDRYIGDIVIPWIVTPGFCSTHFTVALAGLKIVNRYIGNIVLSKNRYIGDFLGYSKQLEDLWLSARVS